MGLGIEIFQRLQSHVEAMWRCGAAATPTPPNRMAMLAVGWLSMPP